MNNEIIINRLKKKILEYLELYISRNSEAPPKKHVVYFLTYRDPDRIPDFQIALDSLIKENRLELIDDRIFIKAQQPVTPIKKLIFNIEGV